MPIPFTCPHCGEQTLADERYAGHEGPCVNCGWVVVVPGDAPRTPASAPLRPTEIEAHQRTQKALIAVGILALIGSLVGIGLLLVGPTVGSIRTASLRRRCASNLEQLALAIDAYERAYGSYPPAYVLGPDGKPWHSWRVLVLPYLGSQPNLIYQQYNLDQPWDSPQNLQLLSSMPPVFASPADPEAEAQFETSYVAVVGPGMAMTGGTASGTAQIADGLAETILLVEVRGAGIAWTEPRDLDGRAIGFRIGTDLGGNHSGGVNVVTADGESHFLPNSMGPEQVHALLTVAGGEDASLSAD